MAYFNFSRLIKKYSREFTLVTVDDGYYDDKGDFVKGEATEIKLTGAIIGFKESKIYRENSTLTARDKHLHMLSEIPKPLMNAYVIFDSNKYKIEEEEGKDNAEFTGVFNYVLKWVSAFD